MQSRFVVLGTGGTIAGTAADTGDHLGYRAAQLGIESLIAGVPALRGFPVEAEQLAQIDSKDATHALWQALAQRVSQHLARPEVAGVIVTHGTDTLEESAYFLHRVLAPRDKPVVITGAMRPATALMPDGPQNLVDAFTLAAVPGARGVLAVMGGSVHAADTLRKQHSYRLDTLASGDAGPLGFVEAGRLRQLRPWPEGDALGLAAVAAPVDAWPRVDIVQSHGGGDGRVVRALLAAGMDGLVVAATGNGTLHEALAAALDEAAAQGVAVLVASRCAQGGVIEQPGQRFDSAGLLTPAAARIELMLRLLTKVS
ncbi:asparaginase [Azohydromonas caseinilytica]|uniref:Asparaginase n=1 Tax=Azohydromonas caseinilytica TaxID=2728836 RepID=A0A848F710_9BURK|nr:asparaginase [Azohydromonas caseinilytica]NML14495.1 asparaginase [Azohydromonas caseinilytica]